MFFPFSTALPGHSADAAFPAAVLVHHFPAKAICQKITGLLQPITSYAIVRNEWLDLESKEESSEP